MRRNTTILALTLTVTFALSLSALAADSYVPKITKQQAEKTALAQVKGAILESDLEEEHGKWVYSVDVKKDDGTTYDIEIDADTGAVLQAVLDD